jgi:predicted metal-dependent peptidase
MSDIPQLDGLAASRLWAAARFPYLASGLFGVQVTAVPGLNTVAIDPRWRLYADPAVAADWTPAQFGSVLVHHVSHLLRDHSQRAAASGVTRDDSADWIRAADAEINDDLIPAGLSLPGDPVLPQGFGAQPGRLAEEYFALLKQHARGAGAPLRSGQAADRGADRVPGLGADREPSAGADRRCGQWVDCGSGADGLPRDCEGPGGLDPWLVDLLARQVAQDIIKHSKNIGTVPAGLLRWATEVLAPTVDWRRLLSAELRRAIADVAGAVDYSYRRPSRRAPAVSGVVLPALRRPVPELAVVCDTSGSMSNDLLAMALAEVEGLLRALGLARRLRVLACDAAAGPARRVTSARQVELTGGGGTDMGAGIAAAYALRPRPALTVVLTDGYTPWPSMPPKGMRVVAGLLGDDAPDAPHWARSVRVPRSA